MSSIKYKKNTGEWSNLVFDAIYPIGSLYISVDATSPSSKFGGTWVALQDRMLVGAGNNYAVNATGGASTVTLTAAQSGVPAHAHGLNGHTHSVGAHSHGLNGHTHDFSWTGSHNHGTGDANRPRFSILSKTGCSRQPVQYGDSYWATVSNVDPKENVGWTEGTSWTSITVSGTTGGNSGSTANSAAFNTGGASGNTANNTAANASQAHENMPPYLAVYMWKRTA